MENMEITNLKYSIERSIKSIPETLQSEYEEYLVRELSFIQHRIQQTLVDNSPLPVKFAVLAKLFSQYNELSKVTIDSMFSSAMAEVTPSKQLVEVNNDPQ